MLNSDFKKTGLDRSRLGFKLVRWPEHFISLIWHVINNFKSNYYDLNPKSVQNQTIQPLNPFSDLEMTITIMFWIQKVFKVELFDFDTTSSVEMTLNIYLLGQKTGQSQVVQLWALLLMYKWLYALSVGPKNCSKLNIFDQKCTSLHRFRLVKL